MTNERTLRLMTRQRNVIGRNLGAWELALETLEDERARGAARMMAEGMRAALLSAERAVTRLREETKHART